ncbi:MAG: NifU family protein [Erysipelotrichaceae bacterium]|nr:NifU family protein [Erysipelotrichaceae bacterium]
MEDVLERIEYTINKIRPYIQRDGGDVEFVSFDENGIVTVRLVGACLGCSAMDSTLYDGIEAILCDEVSEVKGVKLDENMF